MAMGTTVSVMAHAEPESRSLPLTLTHTAHKECVHGPAECQQARAPAGRIR